MEEIVLSVMQHAADARTNLQPLLEQFEAQRNIHVQLAVLDWSAGRSELVGNALYHKGPDVSEIGTTWISDLVAMNALRPFAKTETNEIGKPSDFAPAAWKSALPEETGRIWAVPWLAETNLLNYRADILQQAGIDEQTAFSSFENFTQALQALKKHGVALPMAIPNRKAGQFILQTLAVWVWSTGADFCSTEAGKTGADRILFDQPDALAAMQAYFSLLRFMTPEAMRRLDELGETGVFLQGHAAITFTSPSLVWACLGQATQAVKTYWRVAPPPTLSYVGGSNLVIWNHSRRERAALELVRFLTHPKRQETYALPMGMLPARLPMLESQEYAGQPNLNPAVQALKTGRSFLPVSLWSLIEYQLSAALAHIWDTIYNNPNADLEQTIAQTIRPLARRLRMTLNS